ncbi:Dimer-Tnp-hAT multi-domain protein [Pyrenophora tritici-repentis]|uniref:Dimer-Tnp-hAT multi-domain protein n=1 Tax=Pyrenophora tritici-repentis TaxID=45151 RepID=A0A317AQ24_9PLEO|nr:Dimer-Tnp-hAT multi-domain protein [Pyrenophora tritici-repentis]KAF7447122.1 Dimer-Tnp-hAT multi-domain protein [Pyrenophora tritici-repentis]KAF7569416.1 Dimer-Tnp-hAT multi-domain protein [Pyrenophora tritici-repentis]
MQFSIIAIVFAATFAAATPNPGAMMTKRTCGTLTGTPLKVCQTACKATCTVATAGIASTLCNAACTAGPLKRDLEAGDEEDIYSIAARSAEPEADLARRMAEAEADPEAHVDMLVARVTGQQVCNIACDVACNSTVLALAQTKCLQVCKGKNRGNFINNFIEPAGLTENEEDEYEAWKRSEPIAGEGVDPIKYWVELRDRHPSLSKFAIDMLSIPGSSCECERLFSELGDLLEPRRRSISPQLLAAIQCDRRWIRAGFGSGEVPVKGVISDEEMDAKYGVHKWDIS